MHMCTIEVKTTFIVVIIIFKIALNKSLKDIVYNIRHQLYPLARFFGNSKAMAHVQTFLAMKGVQHVV